MISGTNELISETNSMTPEAVRAKEEYLYNAGKEAQLEIDVLKMPSMFEDKYGQQYIWADGKYQRVWKDLPDRLIMAETFETFSLDGLIDYIREDPENLFGSIRHIVRVTSPTMVHVIAPQAGYFREREVVARCSAVIPQIKFGAYMDAEEFQVMVQTCFMESENRAVVLKLAGSVRKEQNMQTADDGVSQKVTINSGISTAADVIVKNPVILTPYRTFHEVEQPESPFVLRFDEDGNPALFTGDGSKWKLEAVNAIKEYLVKQLAGYNVDVIA